jgi:hypothetical protein
MKKDTENYYKLHVMEMVILGFCLINLLIIKRLIIHFAI